MPPAGKAVDSCTLTHRLCYCFILNVIVTTDVCMCVCDHRGLAASACDRLRAANRGGGSKKKIQGVDKIASTPREEALLFHCERRIAIRNAAAQVSGNITTVKGVGVLTDCPEAKEIRYKNS